MDEPDDADQSGEGERYEHREGDERVASRPGVPLR
jgi:hypothetical protein